jgi:DNA-directed RNA polymerase specialized sigma24 family protein
VLLPKESLHRGVRGDVNNVPAAAIPAFMPDPLLPEPLSSDQTLPPTGDVPDGATASVAPARWSTFDEFAQDQQTRFTDALVARFGPQLGVEASAHAMAYAFEHWARVGAMERPLAYLYRVAQSSLRPHWRWMRHRSPSFPIEQVARDTAGNVGASVDLSRALTTLSEEQRVSVLLIHAYGWTYRDVADLLGVTETAITNHVARGRARLRTLLFEGDESLTHRYLTSAINN